MKSLLSVLGLGKNKDKGDDANMRDIALPEKESDTPEVDLKEDLIHLGQRGPSLGPSLPWLPATGPRRRPSQARGKPHSPK